MFGQGNCGPQTGQGPYPQHHLPTALPPPTSSQSLAAWNSVMHRPPAAVPSQINQQIPRGSPFQGPPAGMVNTTNPSHASLPQPPPVLRRMPIIGPYRNSQHNLHYPVHVGTQNSHHFPTPSPPPPPPPVQGHPTYWHPVNLQPKQPISVQGPPIPNTPPPLPPPSPSQPPRQHASSSPVPPSPPFGRPLLPASSVFNISSSTLALDVSGQRNDKVVTSEGRAVESLGKRYRSISALDRSTALEIDIHPAPPKPADEKIMKRIETLCQFIAKNGPGFEDTVRTRESANPEFKFLFGGEPGSDAAVAHEYYRWAKKKYTFGDKLQEGALNVRPSEGGISVQTKPFIVTSVVHLSSDSDTEMEDDITQVDMDQEMERPVEYYREDSDLVRHDHDGKEPPMPQIVQCASAQDVLCNKVPFSEVPGRSDYGHQVSAGSGILPYHEWLLPGSPSNRICSDSNLPEPAGASIAKKSTTVPADVSTPPISSPAVKSGRPFRLVQDYASNYISENCAVPHSKEKHTTAELSVAPGYINKFGYTECRSESDLRGANLGKIEQVVRPLSESGKSFVSPTRVSNVKTRIVETIATSSEIGLSDEPSGTNYNGQGTIHNAASSEAFARNNSLRSLSTGSHENGMSGKETGGEKLRPYSTSVQVDEFGRLVGKGASDSDSDDSLYAGRHHKKRERSRSRIQSPVGRMNRQRRSLQWAIDRRNRSPLENSTAQPCNESKKKKRREKRLKRKEARNNSARVPYAVLQKTKEKRQKKKEKRKKQRIKRRAQEREAKAREQVYGKSNLLGDIPNNVSQVADLDESIIKEFSSTFDGKLEQVEERIQPTSAQAPMGIFDFFLCLSRI